MGSSCPCCSRERSSFVCRSCLTKLLKLYKTQASSHHSLLPAAQARAANGIRLVERTRQLEAKHWTAQSRTSLLTSDIERLKELNDAASQHAQERRALIEERKSRLARVRTAFQSPSSLLSAGYPSNIATDSTESNELEEHLDELASQLASTRQILLQELLDAMDVVECPIPGCRYQIASLPVTSLSNLLEIPKHQLNATLSMLVLLVKHMSTYLGIQLPFVLLGTATKPLIRALSGTMNAIRYAKAYPLYMSSGPTYTTTSSPSTVAASSEGLPSSQIATPASHAQALTMGLKMLGFDAYYLHSIGGSNGNKAISNTPSLDNENIEVEQDDILALLVDTAFAQGTGRVAHVLSRKVDTLRTIDTEAEFAHYVRSLEEKTRGQLKTVGTSDGLSSKKGKYVVVTSTTSSAKEPDLSNLGSGISKNDEGWDLV